MIHKAIFALRMKTDGFKVSSDIVAISSIDPLSSFYAG